MARIHAAALAAAVVVLPAGAKTTQAPTGFLVFVTDRGGTTDIYASDPDGGAARPLVATAADEADPAVAPRGAALAWSSDADGTWQIYVARSGSSEPTQLTSGVASSVEPVWSPSGRRLAFETDRTGNWEIWVMNADGSGLRNVSRRKSDDFDPAWRDEKTVLFTGVEPGGGTNFYRTAVDAPRPVVLTQTTAHESDPAYAPNRTRIALTQLYGRDYEIAVTAATGVRPRRLTRSDGLDAAPAWTTDGAYLVFTSLRAADLELYRVPVAGGAAVNLTRQPRSNEWEAEVTATLPKLTLRGLARAGATQAVPWFTCANPSAMVNVPPWRVVNGTSTIPPAPGDKLCGDGTLNRVLGRNGRDSLAGFDDRDHLEGGNHSDLFITVEGQRDCVYGGYNTISLATVGNLCLNGRLADPAVHVDPVSDTVWPDKGYDLTRGAAVQP